VLGLSVCKFVCVMCVVCVLCGIVCRCVSVGVYMCVYVFMCVYVCVCVCIMYVSVCVYVCVYVYVCGLCVYECVFVYMCMYVYTHTHTPIYKHRSTPMCWCSRVGVDFCLHCVHQGQHQCINGQHWGINLPNQEGQHSDINIDIGALTVDISVLTVDQSSPPLLYL